ncbi:YraN family protein [Ponticaulis profundi]|uniref:UPF0102 protein ACFQDM_07885 n=1 Tax=Ponticaulis profundi TaxID=2665222 RepID=A0ABW1S8Q3_9PROT
MARDSRREAEKRGRWAEQLAAVYLMAKGYKILARRARTPLGELDLVCRKGSVIAIVEVKQRRDQTAGLHAVTQAGWSRIGRAADLWLARDRRDAYGLDRRFDLVLITAPLRIFHFKDHWRP